MSKLELKTPDPLDFDEAGKSWPLWSQRFKIFLNASGQHKEPESTKISLFLLCIGEKGIEIYNTLFEEPFDPDTNEDVFVDTKDEEEDEEKEEGAVAPTPKVTLKMVMKKFEDYCLPRKNIVMETFKLNTIVQKDGQSFAEYITSLRSQLKFCGYMCAKCDEPYADRILKERIILGLVDKKLQLKLLESPKDKLEDIINKCKIAEMAVTNRQLLSSGTTVNEVKTAPPEMSIDFIRGKSPQKCYRCGGVYTGQHQRFCPALKDGVKCNKCGGPGHFKSVCRSKSREPTGSGQKQQPKHINVNELQYSFWNNTGKQSSQIQTAMHCGKNNIIENKKFIYRINERANGWFKRMVVGGAEVEFKLDTGADISCLPISIINNLKVNHLLSRSSNQLYAYNNNKINTFGQIKLNCVDVENMLRREILFEVVDSGFQPILSRDECVAMKLLQRTSINSVSYESKEQFIRKNTDVFEGLGKIPGECSILLKENSVPHLKYRKRIPDSLHTKLKEQLSSMENEGIISPVDYPTAWVNNLQIVEKPNGQIRLCLDPTALNSCIRREHFLIPTAEAIISRLSNKAIFSVLDLKNGFWQLQLERNSSDLTTFMTPFGRYRWNRVPFGINSAPELFMKSMVRIFGDIPNVEIYFDDIFIAGADIEEHDATMERVLLRARENNIKFNKEKIQYRLEEVKFMGQIIKKNTVKPDSKYSDAIMNLTVPQNKTDVMRLLGMFKFLARFIPNLTTRSTNLRELTKIDSPWSWEEKHKKEFEDLKEIICKSPTLRIFDPKLPLVIQTDASKDGIGCVLMQNEQPVAYGSRSLTASEKKWAQIEKELLAIVFACEKFHHFIYGRSVIVQSDHKPLETLVKKRVR